MVCFSAFGGILFGYDTGVIAGVKEMPDWLRTFGDPTGNPEKPYAISSSTESLVVSILSAGTFFGALLGAPVAGTFCATLHLFTHSHPLYRLRWTQMGYRCSLCCVLRWCSNADSFDSHPAFRECGFAFFFT